jgi:hypothetical protein
MRKEIPEIGWGDFTIVDVGDPAVLALRYDWRNNSVFFLHNLAATAREVLFLQGYRIWPMMVLAKASDQPDRLRLRASGDFRPGLVEQVEGEAAEDGEVLGAVVAAVAGAVLVEGDVEHPVEAFSIAQWARTARAKASG